jgi:predicted DNA-binding transcriptional regulator YafY
MRRADRLFRIVFELSRGRTQTATRLADKLEVSERTIYRDIADLVASGVPIAGAAGVGYVLRRGFHLPPLMFDADELAALALGSRMVKGWSDPALGQAAEQALAKIEAVLPERLKTRVGAAALLVPDFHVPLAVVAPLGALRGAVDACRKVRFAYRRADGTASERTVRPLGLIFWGSGWTLAAWCELRGDFRTFRLDRMADVEVLADGFEPVAGHRLEDYLRLAADAA